VVAEVAGLAAVDIMLTRVGEEICKDLEIGSKLPGAKIM
jgi:hypothetical protein